MRRVTLGDGKTPMVWLEFPKRTVGAQLWRVDVGRVPLFLLDTNVEENLPRTGASRRVSTAATTRCASRRR